MNIGIIVYSQTGHTVAVARAVADILRKKGHDVDIQLLRTKGAVKPRNSGFTIVNPPELDEFDALIFGTPVWAFTAAPVVIKFLKSIETLKGKKTLPFAVKGLPFNWTGGNQAINRMTEMLVLNGADVCEGEIVHYGIKPNEEKMQALASRISEKIIG
ncbi:MAG: flavodoxin [Chitinivibrionales bacterium]|nr:flavodoxin [Chitinivibrionales bacterium]